MISDISIVKCAMFSGKTGPRFRCVGHSRHVVYAARSGASGETAAKHQQRGSRFLTSAAPTDASKVSNIWLCVDSFAKSVFFCSYS